MSRFKTLLSSRRWPDFDFSLLTAQDKHDIEKELDFIPSDRLAAVMEKIGQDRFVHLSGRSWKQVSRYLRGDRIPSDVLEAISADTGASIDWLAKGTLRTAEDVSYEERVIGLATGKRLTRLSGPMPDAPRAKLGYALKLLYDRRDALDSFVPGEPEPKQAATGALDGSNGFVRLPLYEDVAASAGLGLEAPAAPSASSVIAFDSKFLREKGAAPDRCSVITARGDSMTPTIPDGSLLVVDHSQTQISNGFIMVINLGDDLLVKRVRRRLDGLVDLISDNHAYAPETIGPDTLQQLRVVGRVVYFCRAP